MLGLHCVYKYTNTQSLYIILLVRHNRQFSVFRTKFIFSAFFLPFIFSLIIFSVSTEPPKWFNPVQGTATSAWCLSGVGSCGNFVGLVPPDRISFGWLASIPFVSIGWKLRLTWNTLDRPHHRFPANCRSVHKAACCGIIRPRPSNGFWRATNQRLENSVTYPWRSLTCVKPIYPSPSPRVENNLRETSYICHIVFSNDGETSNIFSHWTFSIWFSICK